MATRTPTKTAVLTQKIAERAHELFLMRGCEHGHDMEDWLTAESEITAAPKKRKAAAPRRKVEDKPAA
jgi:Protein of unknown function (DUF2934)